MSLRQLNASYVADEDRVMLRLTTQAKDEYRLWLTRAVVLQLLPQLKEAAVQLLAQKGVVQEADAVADFKQQALEQSVKFAPFKPGMQLPLGPEPVLVRSVQSKLGKGTAKLTLGLPAQRQLTLNLTEDLVGKLRLLLQRMLDTARWAAPLESQHVAVSASSPAKGDDAAQPAKVPPKKVLH